MKRLLLIALVLFVIACTKTSSYRGLITNAADNKPLAGVSCYMSMQVEDNHQLKGDFDKMITDSTGYYALEVKERRGYCGMRFSKPGYVYHLLEYEYGDCKELDLQMYPYDAVLGVTMENTGVNPRNYWYNVSYPLFENVGNECGPKGCGPFQIAPSGSETQFMRIPGGLDVVVSWSSFISGPITRKTFVFPRNDTTYITIPF